MDTRQNFLEKISYINLTINHYSGLITDGRQKDVNPQVLQNTENTLNALLNDALTDQCPASNTLLNPIYNVGCLYYNINNYQKAVEYYNKCIALARKLLRHDNHDTILRLIVKTYVNLCDCYFSLSHVDMAKKMIYEAIQAHRQLFNKTEKEKKIGNGDDSSPDFLDTFREFYEKETQIPTKGNIPQFVARTNFLKKTYDETQFICDDINSLSLNHTATNSQITIPSDSDLLQTAMQYQEYIRSMKMYLPLQKDTEQEIENVFLYGIKALKNITSYKKLSEENKKKFNYVHHFLHTELGNWYFCQEKTKLAHEHWDKVIFYQKTMGISNHPFSATEFFTESTLPFLTTKMTASELLQKQNIAYERCTTQQSNEKLRDTALYAHQFIQIDMLLKRHYPSCTRGNLANLLHCIAANYFNLKQFDAAKHMYNQAIAAYVKRNNLNPQNIEDHHRRWLIEAMLDVKDCFKELYDYAGMNDACTEALSLFSQITNQTATEKSFYIKPGNTQMENINFAAFCKHFQKNTSSNHFLNSAQYNNSLAITQKMQLEPTVDDLMRHISSTCRLEEKRIAPIETAGANDNDLRTLAIYYQQLANDMLKQPNHEGQQKQVLDALQTAIQAMQKIQKTNKDDAAFLASCNEKMQELQQPPTRHPPYNHVASSQQSLTTSAASTQSWQPTLFAQTTTTYPATQPTTKEENYSMQLN